MAQDRSDHLNSPRTAVNVPGGQYEVGFDGTGIAFLPLGGTYGPQPENQQITLDFGLYYVGFDGTNVTFNPASVAVK